jgi:SAM-dependent methyltransferase
MRAHNRAFCHHVATHFPCPGPVYEFGSFQVDTGGGADLRPLFPGREFVGCDFREGPGVDRIEDVSNISLPNESAATVVCLETFEHVFEVRRAFDEVQRILAPGGTFIFTSPFHFPIHAYPEDYWRMTPQCLQRMLSCYAMRIVGWQGWHTAPHTVLAMAIKAPAPADAEQRAQAMLASYQRWLEQQKNSLSLKQQLRQRLSLLYRSKGERRQLTHYHHAEFVCEYAA